MNLPDPAERPLLTVDELVELVPGLGRSAAYSAVSFGEIPSIRYGRKIFIPVATLRRQWGIDPPLRDQAADDDVSFHETLDKRSPDAPNDVAARR